MDSNNDPLNSKILADLKLAMSHIRTDYKQLTVEKQRYGNCGLESIENLAYEICGTRVPQEKAPELHSTLVEHELCAPSMV